MAEHPIVIASASRAYPGETTSGDAWQVDWHGGKCRVAVVDALGHGPEAEVVAKAALDALAARQELGPREALLACHQALLGTRGAAASVAWIDPAAEHLSYAGVGNVEARLWQRGRAQRLIAYRGIVGLAMRSIRTFEFPLESDWLLVLHTDGVSARFELETLPEFAGGSPQTLADAILRQWGRERDDATVVIARSRGE